MALPDIRLWAGAPKPLARVLFLSNRRELLSFSLILSVNSHVA